MKFELSIHAKRSILRRAIPLEWVERALMAPQKTENHEKDPDLKRHWKEIPEISNRVLHIVVNYSKNPVRIVTAYLDRGMRGKL